MKKPTLVFMTIIFVCAFTSCEFRKSINKDLMTGMVTKGDGLSAHQVYMTDGEKRVTEAKFKYAQKVFTNFKNMEGFTVENGKFFPDMDVLVLSKEGDTMIYNQNLMRHSGGYDADIMTIHGNLIMATPMHSGQEYTLKHKIWDTKGEGVYLSEIEFKIVLDETIKWDKNGLDFSEIYLMSEERNSAITDGKIYFNEKVRLDLQGLEGYSTQNDNAYLGMKIVVTDNEGRTVLENPDLFKNQVLSASQIKQGISAFLEMSKGQISNPLTLKIEIWDKNSDAQLSAETEITVVDR